MPMNSLNALRVSAWLLWAVALVGMAEDLAGWWLGSERGFPRLLVSLGLVVGGSAALHARRLLAAHASELAALRAERSRAPLP